MAHKRDIRPDMFVAGDELTAAMVNVGFNFAVNARPAPTVNIEDTLWAASIEGVERQDYRVLSVLTTWMGIHHARLNADRLVRLAASEPSASVTAYWVAIAQWLGDPRLLRLAGTESERMNLLGKWTEFQISRRGEDERFAGTAMRVPAGSLRDRAADVVRSEFLIRKHRGYYWRTVIGPTYRADAWAELERDPNLSAAALARKIYSSFSVAWNAKRDFALAAHARPSRATARTMPAGKKRRSAKGTS